MNIMVCGGGFTNQGAEAMLHSLCSGLEARIPGLRAMMWRCPESERDLAESYGLIPVSPPSIDGRWRKLLWTATQSGSWRAARDQRIRSMADAWRAAAASWMLDEHGDFDAMVDISGFAYGDTWGAEAITCVMPVVERCRELSLPVAFMPQAWGSFAKPEVRSAVVDMVTGPRTLCFVRDTQSGRYLEEVVGETPFVGRVRSDLAFAFDGGSPERGEEILAEMGCALTRPVVVIGPSMRVYGRVSGVGASNRHVESLAALVRHCVDDHDADVVLHPSECSLTGAGEDDRTVCGWVSAASQRPGRCFTSPRYVGAADARALIGRCVYLAGSRFHSLVFALSQGIPCMAVGWTHKYRELLASFGLEQSVGGLELGEPEQLIDMFDRGWDDRVANSAAVAAVAKSMRLDANDVLDETASFLLSGDPVVGA